MLQLAAYRQSAGSAQFNSSLTLKYRPQSQALFFQHYGSVSCIVFCPTEHFEEAEESPFLKCDELTEGDRQ